MKFKMIAIDLDGTLLTDDKKISKEDLKVLKSAINQGYELIIATGRRYYSAKNLIRDLKEDVVIFANNGNIVRNTKDDKVLIEKYLNIKDFHTLIREGRKRDLFSIVHANGYDKGVDLFIELNKDDSRYYNYIGKNESRCVQVDDFLYGNIERVLTVVYMGNKDKLRKFKFEMDSLYPHKYRFHMMENMSVQGFLEVMNPLGSKWLSIREYAMGKGIFPDRIISIGDDDNDIEMIEKSGLGIAMKNGTESVKKSADIISETDNNQDGVGLTLKKVLRL